MDIDNSWLSVNDCGEEIVNRCILMASFYFDAREKRKFPISNIEKFARQEITKTISQLDTSQPNIEIQLYCSETTVKVKEAGIPYVISSLLGEYSFSIQVSPDSKISLRRRYITNRKL